MDAFIREPVPPARIKKPVLPKPVNSSAPAAEAEEERAVERLTEEADVDDREMVALVDAAGRNAAENGNIKRN